MFHNYQNFQQPKEKESTSRRIASFFNNLTPNSSSNKNAKKAGFTGVVTAKRSESSSSSDFSNNSELPPIDSKGRLTVANPNSRSTTPSYTESRLANSRNSERERINLSRLRSGRSDKENNPLVNGSEVVVAENAGAGTSSSRSQSDRVIYPVRTKTSDQLR